MSLSKEQKETSQSLLASQKISEHFAFSLHNKNIPCKNALLMAVIVNCEHYRVRECNKRLPQIAHTWLAHKNEKEYAESLRKASIDSWRTTSPRAIATKDFSYQDIGRCAQGEHD